MFVFISSYRHRYLRLVFDTLDGKANGALNPDEIFESFKVIIGITLTSEEFQMIYGFMDQNSDGSVTFEEFKSYWKNSKMIKDGILEARADGV